MKRLFVILFFITLSYSGFCQKNFDFRFWEDSLIKLRHEVLYSPTEEERISLNEDFMNLLESILMVNNSFKFEWDSVKNFSVVTSPDNLFKIFTWFVLKDDYTYENFGFIHLYNEYRKKYIIYPLYDKRSSIAYPSTMISDQNSWYGAVYYKIIPLKNKERTYYTILGWNGNNLFTNEKIIEVLQLNLKSNKPIRFGAKIFSKYESKVSRVILKYSKEATLSLKYENHYYLQSTGKRDSKTRKMIYEPIYCDMIIFDSLIEQEDGMPQLPSYLVPESSMNQGFIPVNGRWVFHANVQGRNPDKKYQPTKIAPRNYYQPVKNNP